MSAERHEELMEASGALVEAADLLFNEAMNYDEGTPHYTHLSKAVDHILRALDFSTEEVDDLVAYAEVAGTSLEEAIKAFPDS